jgi:hypothetical protein
VCVYVELTLNSVDLEICGTGHIRCEAPRAESAAGRLSYYQSSSTKVRGGHPSRYFRLLRAAGRPTVEARHALYTTAQRHAEDTRSHIRKEHSASVKKGGFKKYSQEFDEVSTCSHCSSHY